MRTTNPALARVKDKQFGVGSLETMSVGGAINKTGVLLALLILAGAWTWGRAFSMGVQSVTPMMIGGMVAGLVFCLITIFKPAWSAVTAPLYALCEGLFLGGISAVFEQQYPGMVIQAVAATFATLLCMLVAYQTGLIKVTNKFRMGVIMATGGLAMLYFTVFILGFFGVNTGFMYSAGPLGIGISVLAVGLAALNLVLDFDTIDRLSDAGAPKYMEWYGAFALMVTLVWLYLELLRLLGKMRRR